MKQGILIVAYKNFTHLVEIIDFFDNDFAIYLHIDRKGLISDEECNQLQSIENVKFISHKYHVTWGGINHLKSILLLSEKVLQNPEIEYIHLISGADYPLKNLQYFKSFFSENRENLYLENFSLPAKCWDKGGLNRLEYFHLHDFVNVREDRYRLYNQKFLKLQERYHIKRKISTKIPPLYGGSNWWSLNRECLQYVINFTRQNKSLLRRFRYAFASDEIYFQTVIMNSEFSGKVINDNMRYIVWNYKNGNCPANLDIEDFVLAYASNKFFARKIEYPIALELIKQLKFMLT